jgi:hypothetical protein
MKSPLRHITAARSFALKAACRAYLLSISKAALCETVSTNLQKLLRSCNQRFGAERSTARRPVYHRTIRCETMGGESSRTAFLPLYPQSYWVGEDAFSGQHSQGWLSLRGSNQLPGHSVKRGEIYRSHGVLMVRVSVGRLNVVIEHCLSSALKPNHLGASLLSRVEFALIRLLHGNRNHCTSYGNKAYIAVYTGVITALEFTF